MIKKETAKKILPKIIIEPNPKDSKKKRDTINAITKASNDKYSEDNSA